SLVFPSPFSAVAVVRAQVQQEASAETTEGTGISINCSHPNIQTGDSILWYRQLPGRGPAFLVSTLKGSKELPDPPGRLSVAADRRSSALWLARPRRGDAAVYYCALETRGEEPGLRPGTNRRGRGRACGAGAGGQPRAGPPGGAAAPPAGTASPRPAPPGPAQPRPASGPGAVPPPAPPGTGTGTPALPPGRRQTSPATAGRNRDRSGGGGRRCPGRSDCSRRPRWLPARSSAFLLCPGRRAAEILLPTGSPRSCRRDRPLLTRDIQGLFSGV
ncbi:LOW QUALITY PROTEIN: basic proline-rich protein-like, partial [Harpia harpyja]|uniref:LOW QUALITY PROTEIN: basic proline-rich protein-like n=1 Tax=Harpia harpyja TaxID=202280 RepID=UPI0022B0C69D